MSSTKQLIINCGASRVTAAVVASDGRTLLVDKLVTESLSYDFTNDDAWLDAVGTALHSLHREHKFSGKASFIIPGNQVLTKTIRIPHVEEAKRAQIIAFEAQQNMPYPLHEVVWDYQIIGDDGIEIEVLFIACKSNTIDEFTAAVSRAGFTADSINAATILDYNALQYSFPSLEEDVLLINIGARSTNLLFKSVDGFFIRNIQLGGNTLTQGIADSLGKSFAQAEEIKRRFFSGDIDHSQDDSGAKLLNSSSESFIRRLGQEITRSVVNYRRQKGAAAPTRILLSGRGALLEGITEKLSVTQKIPVETFDPLQNVTLDGDVGAGDSSLRFEISEIIGAASKGLVADAAGVNLLPEGVQKEMAFSSKKPFLLIAAACLAIAPWPAFIGYKQLGAGYQETAQTIKANVAPLSAKQAIILDNADKAETLSASIQSVLGLNNSRYNWISFFAEIQDSLAETEDAWLDTLSILRQKPVTEGGEPSYEVTVSGQMLVRETANGTGAIDEEVISRRIKLLQSSFENSEFVASSKPPRINFSSIRSGLSVLPFTITLVIDTAKPL